MNLKSVQFLKECYDDFLLMRDDLQWEHIEGWWVSHSCPKRISVRRPLVGSVSAH